jgi:hypothetical protein
MRPEIQSLEETFIRIIRGEGVSIDGATAAGPGPEGAAGALGGEAAGSSSAGAEIA